MRGKNFFNAVRNKLSTEEHDVEEEGVKTCAYMRLGRTIPHRAGARRRSENRKAMLSNVDAIERQALSRMGRLSL